MPQEVRYCVVAFVTDVALMLEGPSCKRKSSSAFLGGSLFHLLDLMQIVSVLFRKIKPTQQDRTDTERTKTLRVRYPNKNPVGAFRFLWI